MSVREYIGARYVPLFADPLTWDPTRTYEPLTVVLYQGNSYTSRQAVPANIDITNTTYWAQTGNYNAQVEQYRAEVETFDGRITANATNISNETTARTSADTQLSQDISQVSQDISDETTARTNADNALGQRITDLENYKPIILLIGDSYCVTGVQDGRGNIYEQLYARLGGKYRIINKSVGGAAFADTGDAQAPYILQQVNAAIADTSFDHSEVDFCIVVGGRNDGYRGTLAQSVNGVAQCGTALRNEFTNAKIVFGIGNWTGQKLTAVATSKFIAMETQAKNIAGCVSTSGLWSALLTGDDALAPASTNYHPVPSGMWRITNMLIAACFGGAVSPSGRMIISDPFSGCSEMVVVWIGNVINYTFTLTSNSGMVSAVNLSDVVNRFFPAQPRYMSANSVNSGNAACTLRFNADGTVQSFPNGSTVVQAVPFNETLSLSMG